jgi:hypothetical protein
MATTAIKQALDPVLPVANDAQRRLDALTNHLTDALGTGKPVDIPAVEKEIKDVEQVLAKLKGSTGAARKHVDTYTKSWAKKAVKKIFQAKVMDNRKMLKLAVDHAEALCANIGAGVDSAKHVLFLIRAGGR